MMKKVLIVISVFLFSCTQKNDVIVVHYSLSSGVELLSSNVFGDIEIIVLHGEGAPLFSPFVNIIVKDGIFFIADPIHAHKVYLFDSNGKYLNSVGEIGRGPTEYLNISDLIIEDNGEVSIYSSQGKLYTYSPQGHFLRNRDYAYSSGNFAKANGFNYHYFGDGSGMPYNLYITDNHNRILDSLWMSANIPYFSSTSPVFTMFEGALILCPRYGNEIYRLLDGKSQVSYRFDFREYAIPAEYFGKERNDAYAFIMNKTVAVKDLFFENQKCAIFLVEVINFHQGSTRHLYGLLEKEASIWKWYYMKENDFMNNSNLKYMDDSSIYFTAEPTMMKEAGLSERFPILNTLDVNDGLVILKCKKRQP